ncbi:MAG: hypothetical protein JNN11_04745 [Candidatus Doudnabacteria bacterium]|nr:hypothetical protein [Candidatus Doudnabacteria bacterium]
MKRKTTKKQEEIPEAMMRPFLSMIKRALELPGFTLTEEQLLPYPRLLYQLEKEQALMLRYAVWILNKDASTFKWATWCVEENEDPKVFSLSPATHERNNPARVYGQMSYASEMLRRGMAFASGCTAQCMQAILDSTQP